MRVIAGTAKGRRLSGPRGRSLRPTADRVKESLFNILPRDFVGLRVLDLFAGTGSLGVEALSRGARDASLVAICEFNQGMEEQLARSSLPVHGIQKRQRPKSGLSRFQTNRVY